MSNHFTYNRWHDNVSVLGQAVKELEASTQDTQVQICHTIIKLIEREQWLKHDEYTLKELGLDKIQGLHKSKTRRRWYDEHPTVHKAFNLIYMLTDEKKKEVGFKILLALNALQAFNTSKNLPILHVAEARQSIVDNIFDKPFHQLKEMVTISKGKQPDIIIEKEPAKNTIELLDHNEMQISSELEVDSDASSLEKQSQRIRIF